MLLTISTDHTPATDLGFLLHKHPDRVQSFDLSFGRAVVFYPEASPGRCAACLLLEIDPVGMVRRRGRNQSFVLSQYVNDRPYVASSFMSVAISQVFGTALSGRCADRPELAASPLPLTAKIEVLPVRGGDDFVRQIFEPLGYQVEAVRHSLDHRFPEWGESRYYTVTLQSTTILLSQLLAHLYVLIPVFDNSKHYFVGEDELQKLLSKGDGWLSEHPLREQIVRRYLKNRPSLCREAVARLSEHDLSADEDPDDAIDSGRRLAPSISLNEQRLGAVLAELRSSGASSVIDLGCGEGRLLHSLLTEPQFSQIVGVDVSVRALEIAARRLKTDRMSDRESERMKLLHASLMYRDRRFRGFDAAAVVEVIEHLDPPRLTAFERVLFECAAPQTVVLTTPNREYNVMWESLPAGKLRHADHRFEWTRTEFQEWAGNVADRYGYQIRFLSIGPVDDTVGAPTQMGVFTRD